MLALKTSAHRPQFLPPPTNICASKKIVARDIITMTALVLACFKISCSYTSLFLFSALLFSNISSLFIEKPPNRIAKFSCRILIIALPSFLVNRICQVLFAERKEVITLCGSMRFLMKCRKLQEKIRQKPIIRKSIFPMQFIS